MVVKLVRRKNTVMVGEGVANAEGVAREVMERFEVRNAFFAPGLIINIRFLCKISFVSMSINLIFLVTECGKGITKQLLVSWFV